MLLSKLNKHLFRIFTIGFKIRPSVREHFWIIEYKNSGFFMNSFIKPSFFSLCVITEVLLREVALYGLQDSVWKYYRRQHFQQCISRVYLNVIETREQKPSYYNNNLVFPFSFILDIFICIFLSNLILVVCTLPLILGRIWNC